VNAGANIRPFFELPSVFLIFFISDVKIMANPLERNIFAKIF
jgi:hypothetical protein